MTKILIILGFAAALVISGQSFAEAAAQKAKMKKSEVAKTAKKKAPQRVVLDFEAKPQKSKPPKKVTLNFDEPVKKSPAKSIPKVAKAKASKKPIRSLSRNELKNLSKKPQRALPATKEYWSMHCQDGYVIENQAYCAAHRPKMAKAKNAKARKQTALRAPAQIRK